VNSWWQKISRLGRDRSAGVGATGANAVRPALDATLAIVGDIHGRADLLDAILRKISKEADAATLVFVGDYVDRGPDSRKVLEMLRALPDAVCLQGNHEVMLLEFLDDPIERGGRWLRNGGVQTLNSFGISLSEDSGFEAITAASQALRLAVADGGENWLRALPLRWQSGNLLATHAGPDPTAPIQGQPDRNFLWGHNRFLRDRRNDGILVAHGHWVRNRASFVDGRINVDTGAWDSHRLTAALITPDGEVRFIDTR